MKSFKVLFITLSSVLTLISCTDEKIIVAPAVESIQSCRADFIQDIEFRYTTTFFVSGDVFVSCELTDFELNKSVTSTRFYSRDSNTQAAAQLSCSLLHEITPGSSAGEFVFDVVNNAPGVTFLNEFPLPGGSLQEFVYDPTECTFESF